MSVCDVELAGFFLVVVVELAGFVVVVELAGFFLVELAVFLVDLSLAGMAGAGVGGRLRQATVRLQAPGLLQVSVRLQACRRPAQARAAAAQARAAAAWQATQAALCPLVRGTGSRDAAYFEHDDGL